jgi:hypothetical protein
MISFKKTPGTNRSSNYLKAVIVLAAVTAIGTAPALAKKKHSLQGLHMSAENFDNHFDDGGVPISAKRAAAVHDCSVQSAKLNFSTWQSAQIISYGACMAEHGEIE